MKLQLAAAVPCKRFDVHPMCEDGRGGWVFSQFGVDRYVADGHSAGIKLGLGIIATPVHYGDYVEYSILIAKVGDVVVGYDKCDWNKPNSGGTHHEDVSVYEWIQSIRVKLESEGIVRIEILLKLNSQEEELPVEGFPLVHFSFRNTNDQLVPVECYSEDWGKSKKRNGHKGVGRPMRTNNKGNDPKP